MLHTSEVWVEDEFLLLSFHVFVVIIFFCWHIQISNQGQTGTN